MAVAVPQSKIYAELNQFADKAPRTSVSVDVVPFARRPHTPLSRPKLPMQASGADIVDRIFDHWRARWAKESSFFIQRVVWDAVRKRVDFVLETCETDARVKHVLALLLHMSTLNDTTNYAWDIFTQELLAWVGRRNVVARAFTRHRLSLQCKALRSFRLLDVAADKKSLRFCPAWICRALLSDRVINGYVQLLAEANVPGATPARVKQLLENMTVHVFTRTGSPGQHAKGWLSTDGVCIVANDLPRLPSKRGALNRHMRRAKVAAICGHVFQLLLLEASHYLLRCLCDDLDTSSPLRRDEQEDDAASAVQRLLPSDEKKTLVGYDGNSMNLEFGALAELRLLGLLIDHQKALSRCTRQYDLVISIATRLERLSSSDAALPVFREGEDDFNSIKGACISFPRKNCTTGMLMVDINPPVFMW